MEANSPIGVCAFRSDVDGACRVPLAQWPNSLPKLLGCARFCSVCCFCRTAVLGRGSYAVEEKRIGIVDASRVKNRNRKVRYPLVGIIMGSTSDWETMEHASKILSDLAVPHETRVVSAHRTPNLLFEYASSAEKRGIEVIIAGAGGAAHLPGMTSSKTVLPVLGVPIESKALKGLDSLLSIAQMPAGIPVGALAIGKAGAINAALLAAAILGAKHPVIREALRKFRREQTARVLAHPDPAASSPKKKGMRA
jgi:5-(carboxyamino)imidazole ribonucleotide mutase